MYQTSLIVLVAMCTSCVAIALIGRACKQKIPLAFNLFVSSAFGALVGGFGIPWRHLIEGPMFYIYVNLAIFTALIMLQVMKESGNLEAIAWDILTTFRTRPILLFLLLLLMLYFPGMVTGVGAAGVLSTGAIVAVILEAVGVPKLETGAILAIATTLGAAAPPVNLPALIIASGINMPFDGFTELLLVLTVPPGIFAIFYLGYKHFKVLTPEEIAALLPRPERRFALEPYLPILTIVILFGLISAFPQQMPDLVSPLVFMIGALVGLFTGKRVNLFLASSHCMSGRLFGVVAVFFVVGAVVQIMTLTGVKGLLVISTFEIASLSPVLLYVALGLCIPLLGGLITHLGAAAVLGVPFALAILTSNTIVVVSCISIFCIMSQIVPPSALGGFSSQDVVKLPSYGPIFKRCLVPFCAATGYALAVLYFAKQFAAWFVPY
jgi:TRAP-type C4-dicarboxylate transport system permease large subunit